MAEYTRAQAFKQAMADAAHTLWDTAEADVQIAFGHPGKTQADDIVAFGRISSVQEPVTIGTRRSREETLTLIVVVSIFRAGGPEQEQIASDRAYKLLGDLENHVRKTDTTVGGTVRDCFLDSHESEGATDPDTIARGRLIEISASFTAHARIATL